MSARARIAPSTEGSIPIDVHLMVRPVDTPITMFAQAGVSIITFHPEASEHIDRSLAADRIARRARRAGAEPGHTAALP